MEIPQSLDKLNIQSQICQAHRLLEKDNPSLAKNEQSFYPNSLCEHRKESIVAKKDELSTETDFLSSQTLSSDELTKLYPHGSTLTERKSIYLLEKDVQDLATPLSDVQISKPSAKFYDQRSGCEKKASGDPRVSFEATRISSSTIDIGKQLVPHTNGVEHSAAYSVANKMILGGSVRTKEEKKLSNLVADEPVSRTGASSRTRFLNMFTFPPRVPVPRPRKKLLILDINGILADVVYPPPKGYKADIKIAGRAVFTRPHCYDFLKFCLERFHVGVWSSRSKKIVDRILDYLIGDMKERLTFCWDISHCTASQFRTLENRHKVMVFKELRMLWENYDSNLPWESGDYSESNTLLLDDSPYKALLNPPHTAIFPYSFSFKDDADYSIGPKGNIRAYLEKVARAENVQEYIEKHPFGQKAITERSMSWEFYNKVIQRQYATTTTMVVRH